MKKIEKLYKDIKQTYYNSSGVQSASYNYTSINLFTKPGIISLEYNIPGNNIYRQYEFNKTAPVENAFPFIMVTDKPLKHFEVVPSTDNIVVKFLNYGFAYKFGKNILYFYGKTQTICYWHVLLQYKPPYIIEIQNHG